MKQNERFLVYAVTGFLALILLVAVFFGRDGKPGPVPATPPAGGGANQGPGGLTSLLGDPLGGNQPGPGSGLPKPADVTPPAGPLHAPAKVVLASERVQQALGPSTRDRNVRQVRARAGDSLEALVRRWCGTTDGFLEEAKMLNEELEMLRVGQVVAVPWVDDEAVIAAYDARQPKKPESSVVPGDATNGTGTPVPASADGSAGTAADGVAASPDFAQPGTRTGAAPGAGTPPANRSAANPPAFGARSYLVKSGDSLWKIADRTYGRKLAERMVGEIRRANPSLGETLREGQKITLPAAPTGG